MRKLFSTFLAVCLVSSAFAQTDSTMMTTSTPASRRPLSESGGGNGDHFLIQLGHTSWTNLPDSIKTSGLPRSLNIYLMMEFPFKTNNHWAAALGPGISTDNLYFDNTFVDIKSNTSAVRFLNQRDTSHYKKNKVGLAYLELPVELRYRFNPEKANSVKIALGARVGTLLSATYKGKELQSKGGGTLVDYTLKEKSKKFFNKNRLSVMGRVGIGRFSAFATYAITPVFREGLGPTTRPLTIGLTLSGL